MSGIRNKSRNSSDSCNKGSEESMRRSKERNRQRYFSVRREPYFRRCIVLRSIQLRFYEILHRISPRSAKYHIQKFLNLILRRKRDTRFERGTPRNFHLTLENLKRNKRRSFDLETFPFPFQDDSLFTKSAAFI